ncbi:MAG: FecCD family ABC transporter permease [Chloroflexota bacterium]
MALAKTSRPYAGAREGLWRHFRALGIPLCLMLLLVLLVLHILTGAAAIAPGEVLQSFIAYDENSFNHIVIRTLRLPRAVIAAVIGGALAVAGAVMQGLTRNPLASPGILGVNAGAVFAVVLAIYFLGAQSPSAYAWFGFIGAAVVGGAVYALGAMGRTGPTPAKLTIAGAAITTLMTSLTTTLLIFSQQTTEQIRFWMAGSVAGRDFTVFLQVLPYLAAGFLLALTLARQITTLSLGEDVARALGQNTLLIQLLAAVSVVLLAGASVAVAGPVGFIGLVIPHVARFLVGVDYRVILPYSALLGSILLVAADIAARLVLRPIELPVGILTALIGAPVFVYLARWRVRR